MRWVAGSAALTTSVQVEAGHHPAQTIITALTPEEIRVILGHELAHHCRWDPWFLRLHVIISAIWWFNPVYWILSRTVRGVREVCCDDMVVAEGIASRESYCQTLLQAARVICSSPVKIFIPSGIRHEKQIFRAPVQVFSLRPIRKMGSLRRGPATDRFCYRQKDTLPLLQIS